MEARIRHLVEEARFFEHSWLVTDGLLHLDRYSAMFGVYGLAEAVVAGARARGTRGAATGTTRSPTSSPSRSCSG